MALKSNAQEDIRQVTWTDAFRENPIPGLIEKLNGNGSTYSDKMLSTIRKRLLGTK